jgi:integrase
MRRNRSGLPKYCGWNTDRESGKRRVRFRKGGFSTYLTGIPWSEDFMHQYAAALEGVKQRSEVGADRTKPGTISSLIVSYYKLVFPTLKASTQRLRRHMLETFRREHGDKPVRLLRRQHVAAIIAAKSKTPQSANTLLKILHMLFAHAIEINMGLTSNPAADVKKFKIDSDGFHTWTEEEVAQFEAHHPVGSKARIALALLLTGQRRSDIIRMGWQHLVGDAIAVRQEKTGTPLLIPLDIDPSLRLALMLVPKTNLTFLVTMFGAPYTARGFTTWFRKRCDAAGLPPQCSAHGLRKLVATRLANASCPEEEIKAITGHRSSSEVARYTKARDQKRLAQAAANRLKQARAIGTQGEHKLSSIPTLLDKTGPN